MLTLCSNNLTLPFKETFRKTKVIVKSILCIVNTFKTRILISVCFMHMYICSKKQTTAINCLSLLNSGSAQYFHLPTWWCDHVFWYWRGFGMHQKLSIGYLSQIFYDYLRTLVTALFCVCHKLCIIRSSDQWYS